MDRDDWESYYALQLPSEQPSDFARFCLGKYTKDSGCLFDIGCGNGRDSLFFSSQEIPVVGLDQSESAIQKNKQKNEKLKLNAIFKVEDFSSCDYDALSNGPYSIYSRFTLHAINYEEENRLLNHLNSGKNLRYLYIEARTIRDGIYGHGTRVGEHEYVTTHYRRFIDPEVIKSRLQEHFDILYFEEGQGFAKTATEDPCLLRLIAKRRA